GPPIDLVQVFAQPLPALMICELLGVPYSEHEYFQRQVAKMTSAESGDVEAIFHAGAELNEYIRTLVVAKRAKPTDDLLSDLAVTTDLSDEELAGIGGFLLGAGFDTTTNMLSLGAFALLDNPEQLAIMRDEPENTDQAVEELMRYLSIAHTTSRTATEDIEIAGQTIKAGDTVVVSLQAANRDPKQFPDPDVLDLRGKGGGHLGFGHGVHQCLGQQLARVEMRTALPALLRRFPTLRLAIPPGQVPLRGPEHNIYGLTHLPVTWQS
ncbi:MAG: cytochrome P450, partial [Kutzneria sp.]|nr:cytochrome P450 [Kutzneria sp.]